MSQENKTTSLLVECEECKRKFEISSGENSNQVNHKKEFNINGKSIFLTYYDCPKCGRRHFVQIDDEITLEKLKEVKSMFIKLSVMRYKGNNIHKKQLVKFKKAREDLSKHRTLLMKEYTDKSIHDDETDSNFVVRFSV